MPVQRRSRNKTGRSLPDNEALTTGLTGVFMPRGAVRGRVDILHRHPNGYTSTFPTEIVTCRLPDGNERRVFCKYGPRSSALGETVAEGVAYEADVYLRLLKPGRAAVPYCHGTFTDPRNGQVGLVLDYVEKGMRVHLMPAAMRRAGSWIGRFHTVHRVLRSTTAPREIVVYDEEYYLGWSQRLMDDAARWREHFPWLQRLCERACEWAAILLKPPLTVIHGEYYPRNILVEKGRIVPIDWESAAIAAGEIDLASLTEAWTDNVVRACERGYRRSYRPTTPRREFERRLSAARLYLAFRWLAKTGGHLAEDRNRWYLRSMRKAGIRLGLIEPESRSHLRTAMRGGR